jgi:hypothetical protein
VAGDFNGDRTLDAADIDALTQAVQTGSPDVRFDVNRDRLTDLQDRQYWVNSLKRSTFGDANLDRRFDSRDLVQVFQAGEYDDSLAGNSSWATGDWSGDWEFNSADLVLAFQAGRYAQDVGERTRAVAVPEPCGWTGLATAILLGRTGRWRKKALANTPKKRLATG